MGDPGDPSLLDPFGADNAPAPATRSSASRRWVPFIAAVAVVAALVGVIAFGGDDNADDTEEAVDDQAPEEQENNADADAPEAEADTEQSDAEQPETGARISGRVDFVEAGTLEPGRIAGIAEIDDSLFVFTDPTESSGPWGGVGFPRVLSATERTANGEWIGHGAVIDGIDVRDISQHGQGVVVAGVDLDGRPAVWRSDDGLTWEVEQLPLFKDLDGNPLEPSLIAATGTHIVVSTQAADDDLRFDRSLEAAGVSVDLTAGWRFTENNTFEILGPFWFVVEEHDLAGLGIDPPRGSGPRYASAWVHDGERWELVSAPGPMRTLASVGDAFVRERGVESNRLEVSDDGFTWALIPAPPASVSYTGTDTSIFAFDETNVWRASQTGIGWIRLDVPVPQTTNETVLRSIAGDGDITAAIISRSADDEPPQFALLQDGVLVRFGGQPTIRLEQDGVITHELHSQTNVGDDFRFDPETGLTFIDAGTGQTITTLSPETLQFAFAEVALSRGGPITSILVNNGENTWAIAPVFRIRADSTLADVIVRGDTVTAFVIPSADANLRGELPIVVFEARFDE
ncbi:MAG: hypothetical protein AAGC53_19500 [Actinomycetota bacterium]